MHPLPRRTVYPKLHRTTKPTSPSGESPRFLRQQRLDCYCHAGLIAAGTAKGAGFWTTGKEDRVNPCAAAFRLDLVLKYKPNVADVFCIRCV